MAPFAAFSGFGRIQLTYFLFAQACALIPGLFGDYIRAAYYAMTLRSCSIDCQIGFGSYFSHSQATLARGVGIGAYCIIGCASLGERARLASFVQVLSGQHQHVRDSAGRLMPGEFTEINIGADSWIGSSAIIMADVGAGATVSAGAVVGTPVPAGATAAGNPARIIRAAVAWDLDFLAAQPVNSLQSLAGHQDTADDECGLD